MAKGQNGLNTLWGYYDGNLKLNSGRSQWEAAVRYKISDDIKMYREYLETFTWPDGRSLTRTESPPGGR